MPDIRLQSVTKRFAGTEAPAVDALDLTIPSGSFTTLLGPSGCGKTTTLRMIAGLDHPTDGEIFIGDDCAFSLERGVALAPSKRGLGLVFQSYALWPHLTVEENISFGLQVQRRGKADVKKQVDEVAEALQIDEYLKRYTSELSGGQQQRVAIARVLVMRPSVLLLDEPLSNLDAKLRMDMRAELKRLHQESGSTVVYVTHDQLEALTMSTDIAVMQDGSLQQFAPPLTLYAQPANRFVADFVGNPPINLLEGVWTEDDGRTVVRCGALTVPVPRGLPGTVGDAVTVGLRAEEAALHLEPHPDTAEARVIASLPTGADWYYRIRVGSVAMTVRDNHQTGLRGGDTVWLEAVPNPLKVFDGAGMLIEAEKGVEA